jgi:signal peptidase I
VESDAVTPVAPRLLLRPMPGSAQRGRPGIPTLRLEPAAVRALPLDGYTAPTMPAWMRWLGGVALALSVGLVIGLWTAAHLSPLRFLSVTSGSMVPTLPVGTITAVDTAQRAVHVGELVAFHPPGEPTEVYTHRVLRVLPGGAFKTEGDALHVPDPWTIPPADVIGRVVARAPYAGWAVAVLKVAVLLSLAASVIRLVLRRGLRRRASPVLLGGGVLVGSLLYLLDRLRPLVSGATSFISVSREMMRVAVVNTGWLPVRAFSTADPARHTATIAPDSVRVATLTFARHGPLHAITTIKLLPAPTVGDLLILGLVVVSPFLVVALGRVCSRSAL